VTYRLAAKSIEPQKAWRDGCSAASLDLLLGRDDVVPYLGGNIGHLYGSGLDDDFFAGPEIGIRADAFNAKVAYDMPFNRDAGEGVVAMAIGSPARKLSSRA